VYYCALLIILNRFIMRKLLIFSITFFSFFTSLQAQFWMELGVKGLVGTTIPYNKHTFSDSKSALKVSADYAYGAKIAANFGDNNGIIVDGLFSQTKANYTYDVAGLVEGTHNLSWKAIDIYPMYRHYYERSFIEIGPKISMLQGMTQTNVLAPNGADAKQFFNTVNYGASFGFGGFLIGSEYFSLCMNFRIDYVFSDFVSEKGQNVGTGKSYPLPFNQYDSYGKTNPISARAGLELAFPIGGFAKAQCGRRVFFLGGNR
jgi:hypothetical protein